MSIEPHQPNPGSGLALSSEQDYWTERQLAALRQIGVERAGPGDLTVYLHVAQRTGLDPFARQIYMVQRDGKQVIQTGIDGYRLVAQRAANRDHVAYGIGAPEWCDLDGNWLDVWLLDIYPTAARVTVTRAGQEFVGIALWREYVQTTRDRQSGQQRVTRMWDQRPAGQLAKCAEALALRRAFPQDLSGVYVDTELDQAGSSPPQRTRGLDAVQVQTEPQQQDQQTEDQEQQVVAASSLLDTSSDLAKAMFAAIGQAGYAKDEVHGFLTQTTGRTITSSRDLTEDEARRVLDQLRTSEEQA